MFTSLNALGLRTARSLTARRQPSSIKRRNIFASRPTVEGLEKREVMAALGLDPTFGFGGLALVSNPPNTANTSTSSYLANIALQGDGKIIAVGSRSISSTSTSTPPIYSYAQDLLVERFNPDSSVDTTFGTGGVATIPLQLGTTALDGNGVAVAVQGDGKLVLLASATSRQTNSVIPPTSSINDFAVVRLNTNGSIDTSFSGTGYRLIDFTPAGQTGSVISTPTSLALAPGGKIVAAGNTEPGSSQEMAVARLNPDGSFDTTFNTTGKQVVVFALGGSKNDTASAVLVGPDSKVVLVGTASVANVQVGTVSSPSTDIAVARLNDNGSLDTSFGTGGKVTIAYDLGGDKSDSASAAIFDGVNIVIAGTSTVSSSSNSNVPASNPLVSNLTLTRLTPSGALDTTFNGTGKFVLAVSQPGLINASSQASGLTLLPDMSYLVGGTASQASYGYGSSAVLFAKVLNTGTLDSSFGTAGVGLLGGASLSGNIVVQPGGKILFANYAGVSRTTAPPPQVLTALPVTTGTGKKLMIKSLTLKFNTAVHSTMAGKISAYQAQLRVTSTKGKVKRVQTTNLKIKSVQYDPNTYTVTINLAQPVSPKSALQVVISSAGIVGFDSQVLNNGLDTTVMISPPIIPKV